MIFLIEYDRPTGNLVTFKEFSSTERQAAHDASLAIELDLNRRGIEREVVLLEAESKDALRQTHRRYFEDLRTLAQTTAKSLNVVVHRL